MRVLLRTRSALAQGYESSKRDEKAAAWQLHRDAQARRAMSRAGGLKRRAAKPSGAPSGVPSGEPSGARKRRAHRGKFQRKGRRKLGVLDAVAAAVMLAERDRASGVTQRASGPRGERGEARGGGTAALPFPVHAFATAAELHYSAL